MKVGTRARAIHFGDHLQSRDHLRSGIICGTVQLARVAGPPYSIVGVPSGVNSVKGRQSEHGRTLLARAKGSTWLRG